MKRFFAVFLSAVLCFSLAAPVYAVVDESLSGIATPVVNTAPGCPEEWPYWVRRANSFGYEAEFLAKMVSLKAGYGWGTVSSLEELSNIASRIQSQLNSVVKPTSDTVAGARLPFCSLSVTYLADGTYTFSMVSADGEVGSVTFTLPKTYSSCSTFFSDTVSFNGYRMGLVSLRVAYSSGNSYYCYLVVQPEEYDTVNEFVYLELVEGDSTDLTAEYIESVVVMDKDDLNTPSLAVRTDLDITGYQIGGVRPSLPTKGLVWALVEDGMITSLQIYNGQAWESVDGRIWTGSRWVPYYAYDVILLKDLYDVVESDPSLDYIYTESGFWKWLQSAWAQMMSKLDAIHVTISGLGSSSGGSGSSGTINPDPEDPDFPDSEDGSGEKWSIVQLFGGVVDGVWVITTGVVNTCVDGVSGLVDTVGSAGDFFAAYRVPDGSDDDLFGMFTYEGSDIWD